MVRGLKFCIYKVEGLYYLCSENKGADQLRGYREADLRLCFRICKKPVFSRSGSIIKSYFFRTPNWKSCKETCSGYVVFFTISTVVFYSFFSMFKLVGEKEKKQVVEWKSRYDHPIYAFCVSQHDPDFLSRKSLNCLKIDICQR